MIHTYRDPDADARPPGVALPLVFILVGVALVSWFVSGRNPSLVPFAALGLLWCGGFLLARRQRHNTCREIRLDDDGTCELHTEGRVVPLHVHQIRTVRGTTPPPTRAASATRSSSTAGRSTSTAG